MVIISISDPLTEEEGTRQQHTSYLIKTDKGNSVRRRFSDFQWLHGRLRTEFPGAVVPFLPHSRALKSSTKFSPEFVEARRLDLQVFLQDVVDHEELARAPSMSLFISDALGSDFEERKKKVEAQNPTSLLYTSGAEEDYGMNDADGAKEKSPGGAQRAKKGISNFFAKIRVSTGSKELMATENEKDVADLAQYVSESAGFAKALVKASDGLVKCTADLAASYADIGVPIGDWRAAYQQQKESPESNNSALDTMSTLVEFSTDFSKLIKKKHSEEESKFGYELHCLSNRIIALQMALKQRRSIQVQYTATNKQIIDKDNALDKANKNLKPPEVTDKLKNERSELEKRSDLEKKVLGEATQRLLKDAAVMKQTLMSQLQNAFLQFGQLQLAYSSRIHKAFSQLVLYLDENPSNGAGSGDGNSESPPLGPALASTADAASASNKEEGTGGDDDIQVEDLDGPTVTQV